LACISQSGLKHAQQLAARQQNADPPETGQQQSQAGGLLEFPA